MTWPMTGSSGPAASDLATLGAAAGVLAAVALASSSAGTTRQPRQLGPRAVGGMETHAEAWLAERVDLRNTNA